MKKVNIVILLVVITSFFSCKKKEEDPDEIIPQHNLLNQNLSGKIGGKSWEFKTGNALRSNADPSKYFLEFYDSLLIDSCKTLFGVNKAFTLDIRLNKGINTLDNYNRVTLYVASTNYNYAIGSGTIEIFSIDTLSNLMKGKLNIKATDENYLSGNFTLKICK